IVYAGISEPFTEDSGTRFAIVVRNCVELVGFFECRLPRANFQGPSTAVPELILMELVHYRDLYNEKFAGVAFPEALAQECPSLTLKLWKEFDAVPLVIDRKPHHRTQADQGETATFLGWEQKQMDEQADSMARKCIRSFGIGHVPLTHLDMHGRVEVDNDFRIHLADATDYQLTAENRTWDIVQRYANELKVRHVKVAFFGATPQSRPDVHGRYPLMRLSHCLGIDFNWYVPRPRPELLHIIRKMQDILQGVGGADEQLTTDEELRILEWVYTTAKRYWLNQGGPLRPIAEGGADVIVIDDGILSPLALISKQEDPTRPVVFENRLHIQEERVLNPASPQYQAWDFLRARLKHVDLLVCQEPREFCPSLMPEKKVGFVTAAVDQLDGLNKPMSDWDISFYGREFSSLCRINGRPTINYPTEQYILHLAQLIPNEGTMSLLNAYKRFYHECKTGIPNLVVPKLLICHYRSPNNRESAPIYRDLVQHIKTNMQDLMSLISFVQIRPPDQLWNTIISRAMVVVQLGDSEGIPEILLSAVQKEKPVIASRNSGYLSFLRTKVNALLVGEEDIEAISRYLIGLASDSANCRHMGQQAPKKLSDETTTVGNAVNWLYITSKLSRGEAVEPSGGFIFTLAQQGAGMTVS
ncbi:hypothetical protein ARAM_002646, partial [Aspergillus rambellii]